jgi:hypothetical protein
MSTRASSALRAFPARPKAEAAEIPDFGRLVEDLRADLYLALEHGQVSDLQKALRGHVGENEVLKQIRGTHRPSGAVLATMLWFVRAGAQARNLERLCATYGRTTVPAAEKTLEEGPLGEQLGRLMVSVGAACQAIAARLPGGLSPDEAREVLPLLQHLKREVASIDAEVLSALTGGRQ